MVVGQGFEPWKAMPTDLQGVDWVAACREKPCFIGVFRFLFPFVSVRFRLFPVHWVSFGCLVRGEKSSKISFFELLVCAVC